MSFFVPALTLTLLIGLIIYFLNQWVGRGKRNSTLLVWVPAWVSAGVLAAIGAGLAAFMRVDLSPGGAVMGQPIPPLALQASPLFTALTCLPLGLFAAGFGRMTTVKSTRGTVSPSRRPPLFPPTRTRCAWPSPLLSW